MKFDSLPHFIENPSETTVSNIAQFDGDRTKKAVSFADELLIKYNAIPSIALRATVALTVDNYFAASGLSAPVIPQQLENQLQFLIREERNASMFYPTLPSIGWEVEVPRHAYGYFIQTQEETLLGNYLE